MGPFPPPRALCPTPQRNAREAAGSLTISRVVMSLLPQAQAAKAQTTPHVKPASSETGPSSPMPLASNARWTP